MALAEPFDAERAALFGCLLRGPLQLKGAITRVCIQSWLLAAPCKVLASRISSKPMNLASVRLAFSSWHSPHWLADGMRTGDFSKQKLDAFFKLPYGQVDIGLNKVR